MPNRDSNYWVKKLKLEPHPEGGWFKEVYRSKETIDHSALPDKFTGSRNYSTAIYYLLEKGDYSAFHRIKSDELWHFYDGDSLEIIEIALSGELTKHILGLDIDAVTRPQITIPAGSWFAARPLGNYTLAGCTVSPGFDFQDFEMASREALLNEFPQHKNIIEKLCKETTNKHQL